MKTANENIAIYWGAFNPPTIGHAQLITGVIESWLVDKIIFSPDGMRTDKTYGIQKEKREEIIEIFFWELKRHLWDRIDISRYFLEKDLGHTTTREVDTYFRETLGYAPYHIFGSDVAPDMPDWANNEDGFIQHELKKLFVNRPGYEFQWKWLSNYMLLDIGELTEVSSSCVREMIQNRLKVHDLLTPAVAAHIDENKIDYN